MSGTPLSTLLELFFVSLVIVLILFIFAPFFSLPFIAQYGFITRVYTDVSTGFDASFLIIFGFAILIDIVISYVYPSIIDGIANIILLLFMAWLSLNINVWITAAQALQFQTYLPLTYTFFTSIYALVVTFIATAFCIIFNFRTPDAHEMHHEQHAGIHNSESGITQ